jgi:eukaryotic-like serine/threonine-protein kinase
MEQLGDYLVRRLVGEGGMGKVYEGEERLSRRRVALKVLHPELAKSEMGRRLFLNEMQILAHLEHPNIVRSLASIEVSGQLVMVLEYLEGRTLRTKLGEEGRLPWTEAIRVVASVASALSAAHGQEPPIIHRDLKPENIMILEGGAVKVMDFGIAKVLQAMNQTNTQSVGTLQYMSPEQIDARTLDHRSDLYCLGLIFYELLAGKAPFHSASPRQLLNLQCTAEPPPFEPEVRAGLPKGVEQLVFQLLEKAPEDRPYLAQDVVDRLEPFQAAVLAPARTSAPRTVPSPVLASEVGSTQPREAPPRVTEEVRSAPRVATERPAERDRAPSQEAPVGARKDTIALVDQVDKPREVPTRLAAAIIVGLSLLAGIAAYALRAAEEPEGPAPSPTATARAPGVQNSKTGVAR